MYYSKSRKQWIRVDQMHGLHLLNAFRQSPDSTELYEELRARLDPTLDAPLTRSELSAMLRDFADRIER